MTRLYLVLGAAVLVLLAAVLSDGPAALAIPVFVVITGAVGLAERRSRRRAYAAVPQPRVAVSIPAQRPAAAAESLSPPVAARL